jgi:metal-dependent amidase/aminoacylase/carboxypeptidase family protein
VSTGIGGTGVVGVLRNGDGPTVMLRADMDALPVREDTGLPYASTATGTDPDGHPVPVAHACGHDMHVTWLAGATKLLAGAGCLARNTHLTVPTRRGAGDRSAGHDRRPPVRPLPQT